MKIFEKGEKRVENRLDVIKLYKHLILVDKLLHHLMSPKQVRLALNSRKFTLDSSESESEVDPALSTSDLRFSNDDTVMTHEEITEFLLHEVYEKKMRARSMNATSLRLTKNLTHVSGLRTSRESAGLPLSVLQRRNFNTLSQADLNSEVASQAEFDSKEE